MLLEGWYLANCDGDWEHEFGVEISTLDSPGWRLVVDLTGTPQEGKLLSRSLTERSDTDWYSVSSDGVRFDAAGGAGNLRDLIEHFASFAAPNA